MHRLFGHMGLLVLDADQKELKNQMAPPFSKRNTRKLLESVYRKNKSKTDKCKKNTTNLFEENKCLLYGKGQAN
jgi:uncharacterized protein YllA (UPF0747 family)